MSSVDRPSSDNKLSPSIDSSHLSPPSKESSFALRPAFSLLRIPSALPYKTVPSQPANGRLTSSKVWRSDKIRILNVPSIGKMKHYIVGGCPRKLEIAHPQIFYPMPSAADPWPAIPTMLGLLRHTRLDLVSPSVGEILQG